MYSLKNREFAGVLALLMLLSMTGCAGTASGEESSGSTVTQEEYDALEEQNEQLQAELDELKGETSEEAEDGTEPDASGEGEDASGSIASSSAPAGNASSSAPAQTSSVAPVQQTAPAQTSTASGKGLLAKYTVRVSDSSTSATKVQGELYNGELAYVFYSSSGKVLGTVPDSEIVQILWDNNLTQAEDDEQKAWFVENFNIYRGLDSGSYESGSGSTSGGSSSEIDLEECKAEFIRLTNEEREKAELDPYKIHDVAMEFSQIRAEEISQKFSHARPNGDQTGTYSHYAFGENIVKGGNTPESAIKSLMGSSIHKSAILSKNCKEFGVRVYEKNSTLYWVQEFVWWDSEG